MEEMVHRRQTGTTKAQARATNAGASSEFASTPENAAAAAATASTSTISSTIATNKFYSRIKVLITLHPARLVIAILLLLILVTTLIPVVSRSTTGTTTSIRTSTSTDSVQQSTIQIKKSSQAISLDDDKASEPSPAKPKLPDLSTYEGCTVATPPPRTEWTTKPLWFPSYPNSIEENLLKKMISTTTGLNAGAKSFYASSRNMRLRHCFGKTETAACMIIHPMVEMTPGPDAKFDAFAPDIVFLMRNPTTAMPAFLNGKRIKYAKLPGQQPENEWRKARDDLLENGLWEGWKNQLNAWKTYKYKVGMYLVYEHLMDAVRGPQVVAKVAAVMEKAGFPVPPKEDMACLWYQSVGGKEALEHYYKYRYDFDDYVPGFTKEQQEYMLHDLSRLVEQHKSDAELVDVLNEFHDDIRDNLRLDSKWVNESAT